MSHPVPASAPPSPHPLLAELAAFRIDDTARPSWSFAQRLAHENRWKPSYAGQFLNSGQIYTPGNGGRRAGVAVGEGKVFVGLPDGRLVALQQVDGKPLWEAQVGSYKANAKISTAPIYVNGMVLVGDGSGDGGGNSATMQAFRAANGGKIWAWSAIPAPVRANSKADWRVFTFS